MKKTWVKVLCGVIALIIISAAILTLFKSGPISESSILLNSSGYDDLVFGADEMGQVYSICEHGIFYQKNSLMRYYDFEANKSYVLCDKPNCKHSDSSCGAWYGNMLDATGLALYGENLYVVKRNSERNTYELISMDMTGGSQKIVYSLDIGDMEPGAWVLSTIRRVYYAGGMAWFSVQYQYVGEAGESGEFYSERIIGVNLRDGKAVTLNELSRDNAEYTIELVSKDYILICKDWSALEKLSQRAFNEALLQGEYAEFSNAADPYYEYQLWYLKNRDLMFSCLIYDVNSGEMSEFDSGKVKITYDENGLVSGSLPKYTFKGMYDGKIIYGIPDYEGYSPVYIYDVKKNGSEHILDIENGGTLITAMSGDVMSSVTHDEKILYCLYTENETAKIYYYDLKTKEHVELFEDKRNITFRMIGETSDKYIGMIYGDSGPGSAYMIDKEDYISGNLKAAVKLPL